MLVSTWRRAGEPVVVACGPLEDESSGGLRVGMLFVAPDLDLSRVTLRPISDPDGPRRTLIWPSDLNGNPVEHVAFNVTLKEAP